MSWQCEGKPDCPGCIDCIEKRAMVAILGRTTTHCPGCPGCSDCLGRNDNEMTRSKVGQWCVSRDGERFTGSFDSADEALTDWGPERPVFIAQIGQVQTALDLMLHNDADTLLEYANEQACDGWGTDDAVVDPSTEAGEALGAMIESTIRLWVKLHNIDGECFLIDESTKIKVISAPCWIRWRRTSRIPPGFTSWHYSHDGVTAACGHGNLEGAEADEARSDAPMVSEMCGHCGWQGDRPAAPKVTT